MRVLQKSKITGAHALMGKIMDSKYTRYVSFGGSALDFTEEINDNFAFPDPVALTNVQD